MPPRSFFDANIRREPALSSDAAALRSTLTPVVKSNIGSTEFMMGSIRLTFVADSVFVQKIAYTDNGQLLLAISCNVHKADPNGAKVEGNFQQYVEVLVSDGVNKEVFPNGRTLFGFGITRSGPGAVVAQANPFAPPVQLLFPSSSVPNSALVDSGLLLMPLDVRNRLVKFYNAAQGDPSFASDYFSRMIYFSATTVTTLGFGDITPLTSRARLTVAAETVLGLVVIGLFLNSVATRRRDGQSESVT